MPFPLALSAHVTRMAGHVADGGGSRDAAPPSPPSRDRGGGAPAGHRSGAAPGPALLRLAMGCCYSSEAEASDQVGPGAGGGSPGLCGVREGAGAAPPWRRRGEAGRGRGGSGLPAAPLRGRPLRPRPGARALLPARRAPPLPGGGLGGRGPSGGSPRPPPPFLRLRVGGLPATPGDLVPFPGTGAGLWNAGCSVTAAVPPPPCPPSPHRRGPSPGVVIPTEPGPVSLLQQPSRDAPAPHHLTVWGVLVGVFFGLAFLPVLLAAHSLPGAAWEEEGAW